MVCHLLERFVKRTPLCHSRFSGNARATCRSTVVDSTLLAPGASSRKPIDIPQRSATEDFFRILSGKGGAVLLLFGLEGGAFWSASFLPDLSAASSWWPGKEARLVFSGKNVITKRPPAVTKSSITRNSFSSTQVQSDNRAPRCRYVVFLPPGRLVFAVKSRWTINPGRRARASYKAMVPKGSERSEE